MTDDYFLQSLLSSGATLMKEKLSSYARNQLPGGIYWDPDPSIKPILKSLKPNNDVCESILGLNDYLSTALPNMHQMTKSNLVQVKKNKTVQWLDTLPPEQQERIVELARKSRVDVAKACKDADSQRSMLRREKMMREKCRRDALEKRAAMEKERLSKLHLMAFDELKITLSKIGEEDISNAKKTKKKLALIREQINIRKKLLGQKINIPFTCKGKQRSLVVITEEFLQHLQNEGACSTSCSYSAQYLVGKTVLHKFLVNKDEKWFRGYIVNYSADTNEHEISYEDEDEHYFFNLLEDISLGDLIVTSD